MIDLTKKALIVLSSCKNGFAKEELFDESPEKYWSSDGKAPHYIVAKFKRFVCLREIHLFLDYDRDESYTPNRIYLKAGFDDYSAVPIFESDIVKPKGWICIQIDENVPALYYQILFPYNYLNGKDLRIRGLRLIGEDLNERQWCSGGGIGGNIEKSNIDDVDLCLLGEKLSGQDYLEIIR